MIRQWKPADSFDTFSPACHNYGDHLPELFEPLFVPSEWQRMIEDKDNVFILLGSMLYKYTFEKDLDHGRIPHYLGCGFRGDELEREQVARIKLFGCRGTLTRAALQRAGQKVKAIGDPAELMALLVDKPAPSHKTILVPHILDPMLKIYESGDFGCDHILSPITYDHAHLVSVTQEIAAADFVFAGAMHAAIVANAYGVPFAFFDAGHRDCPIKWEDWGTSVGLDPSQIKFFKNAASGRAWYESIKKHLRRTRLLPILWQANKMAKIKPSWLVKAFLFDRAPAR